eukprot:CAMPEP_0170567990 /NCGR_PEP_ID=MMETSP0211-20121228/80843_1 /TAXON_ID=311385 /ORGANISM="Pseudokeronopsis sp., Strain OXSARD2" /LENGTH=156 /DNA_ID=CAMNT_0010889621 /DNA_START=1505 /DNA_END=1975 /DNA_ORIENTATION=+
MVIKERKEEDERDSSGSEKKSRHSSSSCLSRAQSAKKSSQGSSKEKKMKKKEKSEEKESEIQMQEIEEPKNYYQVSKGVLSSCPDIIKKQMEEQNREIRELKMKIKEQDLRLNMKKSEFDKVNSAHMKKEILKHKEKIEQIFRTKLDEEKRKVLKT